MKINITASVTEIISALSTLATSILTGIYIFYTRKTFLEMKKQTDNQIRAYLFSSKIENEEECTDDHLFEFRKKYEELINNFMPEIPKSNKNIFIELKNRGKTDIIWWKISINVTIQVGAYLSSYHISEDNNSFNIEYKESNQIIQPECSIKVCIGALGYIPKADFQWTIEYKDLHGNLYKEFAGDKEYNYINPLIFQFKKNEEK